MNTKKTYLNIVGILVILLMILGCFAFRYSNMLTNKKIELNNVQLKGKHCKSESKYGYTDIVDNFKEEDGVNIKKFSDKNDKNTVSVEAQLQVDKNKIYEVLNRITNGNNVKNINSIKIHQYEGDMLLLDVNMDFVKNK